MNDDIQPARPHPTSPPQALIITAGTSSHSDSDWTSAGSDAATWRRDLVRWLASLNPGRTPREYEKAVGYFFETPGVPQHLDELTFDLLLAYRGALALRAAPHEQRAHTTRKPSGQPRLPTPYTAQLEGNTVSSPTGNSTEPNEPSAPEPLSPLSPATVNVRLTALRQFLVYCSLAGTLPQLSPDRIRGALRRLSIERRRPYQILAEQEWDQFLRAATLPSRAQTSSAPLASIEDAAASDGAGTTPAEPASSAQHTALPKSRAGLTGERTADRDHALISLALATGLRAVELAGLDLGDLSREWTNGEEEWWLILPDAKTKGQHGGRTLPLAPALVETVLAYVKSTGRRWDDTSDQATPLFLSQTRRRTLRASGLYLRLSPASIRAIVDRVETQWLALRSESEQHGSGAMLAGETRQISPHALRHSTAIALLEGSSTAGRPPASVEHVRGWLGHFDIRTTQGYLAHLDARRHRRPFALTPASPKLEKQARPTPPTSENSASMSTEDDSPSTDSV